MNKNELRNTILSQIQLPCIGKNRMQVEPVPGQMQTRQLQQAIDDLSRQGGAFLSDHFGSHAQSQVRSDVCNCLPLLLEESVL